MLVKLRKELSQKRRPPTLRVKRGKIWLSLGIILSVILYTGCGTIATLGSSSVKFPRPIIPTEYVMQLPPYETQCELKTANSGGSVIAVPCVIFLEEDALGILKERRSLRQSLMEADHTLCLINKECPK